MEKLLFELTKEGRRAISLPKCDVEEIEVEEILDKEYLREEAPKLPEVSQRSPFYEIIPTELFR